MDIFHKGQLRIKSNFEHFAISHEIVHEISKNSFKIDKRKLVLPGSAAQRLHSLINSYMASTGHRLFIVPNEQVPISNALRKLVDEELIHQVPSAVTHRSICDTHKAFLIDFGNFVDHIEAKNKDIESLLNESVLANFPEDFESIIQGYTLDIQSVGNDLIECPRCGKQFLRIEPVFLAAKLCKHCAYKFSKDEVEKTKNDNSK